MNRRTTAFLVRSLRQESRLVTHHVLRACLAALVFTLLVVQVVTATLRTGAGGRFAMWVLLTSYWFITLLGGVYFSSAIVEEKEEQTLPLLRMTGASVPAILLGKSLPRLASVLLFLSVGTPFLFLAVTLGGTILKSILTAVLGILVYAIMMSQLGLLASVVSRSSERALSLTLLTWFFLEFLPFWCWLITDWACVAAGIDDVAHVPQQLQLGFDSIWWTRHDFAAWIAVTANAARVWTEPLPLISNLSLYAGSFHASSIWQTQMTVHLLIAVTAFGASWLVFEPCTQKGTGEVHDSPRKTGKNVRRRVGGRALVWKSWQHLTGGWLWFWLRVAGAPLLLLSITYAVMVGLDEPVDRETLGWVLYGAGFVLLIGHVIILFGRLFGPELQHKTLSSLLMLPISKNRLLCESCAGLLPAICASAVCFVVGLFLLVASDHSFRNSFYDALSEPWTYQLAALGLTTIVLGIWLSLYIRNGGMLLSVATVWFLGPFVVASFMMVLEYVAGGSAARDFFEDLLPLLLFTVEFPLWVALYRGILRALARVGERS